MAERSHVTIVLPRPAPFDLVQLAAERPEASALVVTLLVGFLARVISLGSLEPNISADEAALSLALLRLLHGQGPGPFELLGDGTPAIFLYPGALLGALIGPSYLALRWAHALASLAALVPFYWLARRLVGPLAGWAATLLLATSAWFLCFSRSGELAIWPPLLAIWAAFFVTRALEGGRQRDWIGAGVACGLGWHAPVGGVALLPAVVLYLSGVALARGRHGKTTWDGLQTLVAAAACVLLPRLLTLGEQVRLLRERTVGLDTTRELLAQVGAGAREYLLLDTTLGGNGRYLPPGAAVLDSFSGTLFVVGLLVGLRWFGRAALWWSLLLVAALLVTPWFKPAPDLAVGVVALPAMLAFVGLGFGRLAALRTPGGLLRLGLIAAVPLVAALNLWTYVAWMRSPVAAVARGPAVEVAEFAAWQTAQRERVESGQPGLSAAEWQRVRGQYRAQAAAAAGETAPSTPASVAGVEARPRAGFGPVPGLRRPRGVALDPGGGVYVLEADGRILRLDMEGKTTATFGPSSGGPKVEEPADLLVLQDGTLYLLDAGRGAIDRFDASGKFVGSMGSDWGTYRPRGLALGPDGRLYVADTGRNRVVIASPQGKVEETIGDLEQPTDVAVDGRGWVYVALPESSKIQVFDANRRPLANWQIPKMNTVDGPHLAFLEPGALAVTEPGGRRVVLYDPGGRELGAVSGGDLRLPYNVAVGERRLVVADSAAPAVRLYDLDVR